MSKDKDDNVFKLVSSNEDNTNENTIPQSLYRINYAAGGSDEAYGFLVFTTHHVGIMRDNGDGAIPVLVAPLGTVKSAQIVDDYATDTDQLPF